MFKLEPQKQIIEDITELMELDDEVNLLDIIIEYSERNHIDIEYLASVIGKNAVIKAQLQIDAENLNFLPKRVRLDQ